MHLDYDADDNMLWTQGYDEVMCRLGTHIPCEHPTIAKYSVLTIVTKKGLKWKSEKLEKYGLCHKYQFTWNGIVKIKYSTSV